MILQARFGNPSPALDLENSGQQRCTYRCTRVEISAEMADIISAWPSLTDRQRQALSVLSAASAKRAQ
jgi:hypothetical protein